jgi:hypothetical protein
LQSLHSDRIVVLHSSRSVNDGGDKPQIEIAEDISPYLAKGQPAQTLVSNNRIDIEKV